MRKIFVTCVIGLCTAFGAAAQDVHVVLTGSGGEAEYRDQFIDWGKRLIAALEKQADADPARIHWLAERANGQPAQAGDVSLESIEPMITKAADQLGEADDLYIYIIGHGSAYSRESKFHIPGPDVSAEDFAGYLEGVSARRIVILNATPSSAGWINVLSGPNRVICTATKSVGEFNATRFMEYFIQALEDGSADRNHDDRMSFEEICRQAAELTAGWYTAEGLIATEHAIIDDNGDGLGTRLFNPEMENEQSDVFDGKLAAKVYLKDFTFPASVPQELADNYLAALEAVELWKEQKETLERREYYAELEKRLLDAARLNRDIRRHMPADNGNS